MRLVEINMCSYGSTGRIMLNIADIVRKNNGEALTFSTYRFSIEPYHEKTIQGHIYYGSRLSSNIHYLAGRLFGKNGFYSKSATQRLIRKIDAFKPDIIHLHNLHGFCINLPILFRYLRNKNVVWTLHDCWSFTGHCAHYMITGCDKWKSGCEHCEHLNVYPKEERDRAKINYDKKKELFLSVTNLTLVTPSIWLKKQVEQSFLKEKTVKVINNGIDLGVFRPISKQLRINPLNGKKVVLGVSYIWGYSKGLDVFERLADELSDEYAVILVGVDKKTSERISKRIICIEKTENMEELATLYSRADVFVNPTREDTFPTVNIEALACGTPVVTFDTGGSPEIVNDTCGSVVECNDYHALKDEIIRICEKEPYSEAACVKKANSYDKCKKYEEYIALYNEILK